MKARSIRQQFLDFFDKNDHQIERGSSLRTNDPELLFTIAGMVPFKPYFMGENEPPAPALTTAQPCLRTEDIQRVGQTARHLTFFEMLGNFSFGDYFKERAIKLAWSFLTECLELNPDRLYVTVFGGSRLLDADEQARTIWRDIDGLSNDHIFELGEDENFWAMGETGPCGPCSEILYDQQKPGEDPATVERLIRDEADRVLELWNLVFMQYERTQRQPLDATEEFDPTKSSGPTLRELPQKNIDTGLGLERIAAVMQGADTNFETDLFRPIIRRVRDGIDAPDGDVRLIADHIRATCMLLSEGVVPGYGPEESVLRRLIRRSFRRLRNHDGETLAAFVEPVIETLGDHYTDLRNHKSLIEKRLQNEERQFDRVLSKGRERFQAIIEGNPTEKELFVLHEGQGVPFDVLKEWLNDADVPYDPDRLETLKNEHARESQSDQKSLPVEDYAETNFIGYEQTTEDVQVVGLIAGMDEPEKTDQLNTDETGYVLTDRTPFYAEGGGQAGDRGRINGCQVLDTIEQDGRILHKVEVDSPVSVGETVRAWVDPDWRHNVRTHHTCTHLLHAVLRDMLGEQVQQHGSFLDDERLRFDFTHESPLSPKRLDMIERTVNEHINEVLDVEVERMDRKEAEDEGVLMLFDTYDPTVRVVRIGRVSAELCGGTHLSNTRQARPFIITDETGVGAGIRRIEAKAGPAAYEHLRELRSNVRSVCEQANVNRVEELSNRIEGLQETLDEQEQTIQKLRDQQGARQTDRLIDQAETINDVTCVTHVFDGLDVESLKTTVDQLKQQLDRAVILLVTADESVRMVMGVTDNLTDEYDAARLINRIADPINGGGGGRADFAEAGGSDPSGINEAIEELRQVLRS